MAKKRKKSAKALERRKKKRIQQIETGEVPHHNKAYVDPNLQKQAGAHGENKNTHKHKRRKDKQKLKTDIKNEAY